MYCKFCGNQLCDGSRYCHQCGKVNGFFTGKIIKIGGVIAAVMIVAAVAVFIVFYCVDYTNEQNRRRKEENIAKRNIDMVKQQIAAFSMALAKYEMDIKVYPSEESGLQALIEDVDGVPGGMWKGPYLKYKVLPKDPWGRDYIYRRTADGGFEIISYGKDGEPGGKGENADISSHQE